MNFVLAGHKGLLLSDWFDFTLQADQTMHSFLDSNFKIVFELFYKLKFFSHKFCLENLQWINMQNCTMNKYAKLYNE